MNWDNTAMQGMRAARNFYNLHIDPSPAQPFGAKGSVLSAAWKQLAGKNADGLLILDGDVMIDPEDHKAMLRAIHEHPGAVQVAPARLWPVSTKRNGWTWAHWATEPSMQREDDGVRWFSFCYTYLPRRLMAAADREGLRSWAYPGVDKRMSETAQKIGIDIRVVGGCHPKHMNY